MWAAGRRGKPRKMGYRKEKEELKYWDPEPDREMQKEEIEK